MGSTGDRRGGIGGRTRQKGARPRRAGDAFGSGSCRARAVLLGGVYSFAGHPGQGCVRVANVKGGIENVGRSS